MLLGIGRVWWSSSEDFKYTHTQKQSQVPRRQGRSALADRPQVGRAARGADPPTPVRQAEGSSPGRRELGPWVWGWFEEDMKWVTELSFPGRAPLHLFGFSQSKHYFPDMFNNHSSSHMPVFAFLWLHKNCPLPKLILWVVRGEVPSISIDGHSYGL